MKESFGCCDYIIVLDEYTIIRMIRVFKRWINQRSGRESYNSKPTWNFLWCNIKWVLDFNQMKRGLLQELSIFAEKVKIFKHSKEAYEFIDLLEETGQKLWQILPLGPTSYGDSPYQSFSTFAGNPYFIDLDTLVEKGWLTKEACEASDYGDNESYIDYGRIYNSRFVLLKQAFLNSDVLSDEKFAEFCKANQHWLPDYALYMALKNQND